MKFSITTKFPKDHSVLSVSFAEEGSDRIVELPSKQLELRIVSGKEKLSRRRLITLIRKIVVQAKEAGVKKIALRFDEIPVVHTEHAVASVLELIATNALMADFEFTKYKTKPKQGWKKIDEFIVVGKFEQGAERALRRGKLIGEEVNNTRILANTPGGDMTPIKLAEAATHAVEGLPVTLHVFDVVDMEERKMGAILGVGKGSSEEPRFIVMEYMGGETNDAPIVLVGKGVTFDTGGLNLKPSDHIYEMHMDMSGGAAVIHTLALAARMKLKKNVIGLIPAVENMPSGSSYRPGDVLYSMSGKTIEVLNTDAEGRVILADALHYAKQYKPKLVVDVATLTGAAVVALGTKASAIFTKDGAIEALMRELGEETGDYVWPLPLWDEYEADIKGTFGDWANVGKSREGGAIAGAMFLYQFAKDYPWVHIDMAPRMTATDGEHLAKGAVGAPVRLLYRLLEVFE